MRKRTYLKDIRRSLTTSKGRLFSIFSLMAIGALALIGLKVTTPDMQRTAQHYIDVTNMMDLSVVSDYGLTADDVAELSSLEEADVEFGYLTDVTIDGTHEAVRLFSKTEKVSISQLIFGRMPSEVGEIALSVNLKEDYKIGDEISFIQKTNGMLTQTHFKVTGFVNSSDIWSQSVMGLSSAGSGQLSGYGVLTSDVFKREVYSIARLSYKDMDKLAYHDDAYKVKLTAHKRKLENLLSDNGEQRLAQLKSDIQTKVDQGSREFETARKALEDATPFLSESELVQSKEKLSQLQSELDKVRSAVDALKEPVYTTYTRESLPGSDGYNTYTTGAASISAVGDIFPVVLYGVAAMVTLTTMTRFVDEERHHAGIFKALGYTSRQIIAKFVIYGLFTSLLGTIVGVCLGNTLISPMIGQILTKETVIGASEMHFYPEWLLMALFLALISSVLPAYLVARRELSEEASYLLQAKPPVAGSTIFLEKFGLLWKRLGFTQKVTARNIFRYKQRMFMTIFGVAGSVALLFAGLGIQSSISGVAETQFNDIIHYDMIVIGDDWNALVSDSNIKSRLPILTQSLTETLKGKDTTITMMVSDSNNFLDYVTLRNRETSSPVLLSNDGVVLTEKLAKLYSVSEGDSFTLKLDNQKVSLKVTGITEMYAGQYIYMTGDYYTKVTEKAFEPNAYLLTLNDKTARKITSLAANFLSHDQISAVVQNTDLKKTLYTVANSLQSVMVILITLSALLGLVILYNLTNINVSERIRELSTIKVLGFHEEEVTLYIYRETIVLSFVGIVAGLIFGRVLHHLILGMVGSHHIMFQPSVAIWVYLVPILSIVVILMGLGFVVNHKLKHIDMLEALKSME